MSISDLFQDAALTAAAAASVAAFMALDRLTGGKRRAERRRKQWEADEASGLQPDPLAPGGPRNGAW